MRWCSRKKKKSREKRRRRRRLISIERLLSVFSVVFLGHPRKTSGWYLCECFHRCPCGKPGKISTRVSCGSGKKKTVKKFRRENTKRKNLPRFAAAAKSVWCLESDQVRSIPECQQSQREEEKRHHKLRIFVAVSTHARCQGLPFYPGVVVPAIVSVSGQQNLHWNRNFGVSQRKTAENPP